jgi:hypothetical protein
MIKPLDYRKKGFVPKSYHPPSLGLLWLIPLVMVVSMFNISCITPEEVQLEGEHSELEWNEIMETSSERPTSRQHAARSPGRPSTSVLPRPPDNLHRLIHYMPRESKITAVQSPSRLPVSSPYEGGFYGTRGLTKIFIAPTSKIGDYSRLYWVMVKVLSEKYGCFMVAKQYAGDTTRVFCRDKRQIVFWQSRTKDWIQFASRQYDREGFEIAVKRRRIVRVSLNPVI